MRSLGLELVARPLSLQPELVARRLNLLAILRRGRLGDYPYTAHEKQITAKAGTLPYLIAGQRRPENKRRNVKGSIGGGF